MKSQYLLKGMLAGAVAAIAMTPGLASAEPFSGPYAGVEAGLGILKSKGSTIAGPFKETDNSAVIGAVAGYRMPLGESAPVVLGVEGEAGIQTNGSDARYMLSGIAGVKLGEKALVYGRVGYGWNDALPNHADDGLVLGGGAEVALTDSISARAEYRHIDYGGINFPDNTVDYAGHEITAGLLFNF